LLYDSFCLETLSSNSPCVAVDFGVGVSDTGDFELDVPCFVVYSSTSVTCSRGNVYIICIAIDVERLRGVDRFFASSACHGNSSLLTVEAMVSCRIGSRRTVVEVDIVDAGFGFCAFTCDAWRNLEIRVEVDDEQVVLP